MSSPFVHYRHDLDVYQNGLRKGLSDQDFVAIVTDADDRVSELVGHGFLTTPVQQLALPSGRPVLAKIETDNVGGSHKARHLFGLLIGLLIDEHLGLADPDTRADLAIASCGNAAVGAATVARATERALRVFVPTDADPAVLATLDRLEATVEVCERLPGVAGDPCMAGLEQAVIEGAQPFTVQGPTCPEVIDGGRTLGLELFDQLREVDLLARDLYVQIGGGALASATMDGLERAGNRASQTASLPLPRLHPVQPTQAHPYLAAWDRLAVHLAGGVDFEDAAAREGIMEPWPGTPASVATGILDDITYDWMTVANHQFKSGGWTVSVEEETFVAATDLAAAQVSPPPDATGAAGLAGLLTDEALGRLDESREGETTVVLLTGIDRSWKAT